MDKPKPAQQIISGIQMAFGVPTNPLPEMMIEGISKTVVAVFIASDKAQQPFLSFCMPGPRIPILVRKFSLIRYI